jgi:hypothetical protein
MRIQKRVFLIKRQAALSCVSRTFDASFLLELMVEEGYDFSRYWSGRVNARHLRQAFHLT